MSTVNVTPLSPALRATPARYRPGFPPLFPDGDPTPADIELARDLFLLLDAASKAWYSRCRIFAGLG